MPVSGGFTVGPITGCGGVRPPPGRSTIRSSFGSVDGDRDRPEIAATLPASKRPKQITATVNEPGMRIEIGGEGSGGGDFRTEGTTASVEGAGVADAGLRDDPGFILSESTTEGSTWSSLPVSRRRRRQPGQRSRRPAGRVATRKRFPHSGQASSVKPIAVFQSFGSREYSS
jgi:hypothetical protein